MKRTLVVGDLHGCYDEAVELLELAGVTPDDRVIFCGDLIDRGPDNDKCVDLAMKHECILGNHEERHLQYRAAEEKGKDPKVVVATHIAARAQLKPHHYDYFKTLPLYIRLPEFNSVVVHAGVWPGIPIEEQTHHNLLHIQSIDPQVATRAHTERNERVSKWPSKAPSGWVFWSTLWQGPERVIFGHSVLTKPLITDKVVGIDGGAVFGHELWAFELPSGKIWSVKGHANHGKGFRGRAVAEEEALRGNKIATYPIHDDVETFS